MKKKGDTIYFRFFDDSDDFIGHGKVLGIHKGGSTDKTFYYEVEFPDGDDGSIPVQRCLPEKHPRIQKYIQDLNKALWITRDLNGDLKCHVGIPELKDGKWISSSYLNVEDSDWYEHVEYSNSPMKLK